MATTISMPTNGQTAVADLFAKRRTGKVVDKDVRFAAGDQYMLLVAGIKYVYVYIYIIYTHCCNASSRDCFLLLFVATLCFANLKGMQPGFHSCMLARYVYRTRFQIS